MTLKIIIITFKSPKLIINFQMEKCNSIAFEIPAAPCAGSLSPSRIAPPKQLLQRLNPNKDPLTMEKIQQRLQRAEENRQ